jgi:hypothetical protein
MNRRQISWAFGTAAALAAVVCCAGIEGAKAEGIRGQEICIVGNDYTGADFRDAYERRIRARGYTTRVVQAKTDCPITTTYVASYGSTGWGRYMKTAMLTILRDGEEIAVVRYNVARGKPFKGKVEDVIGEMVEVLYP